MKLSEVVAVYIELRNKKAALSQKFKEQSAKIDTELDKIEAALLKTFDAQGVDSAATKAGTAYISERTSATVADKDVFQSFVKDNGLWDIAEIRCSKTGVQQYKDEHGELPPGINWRVERTIGVRAPTA